MARAKAGGQIGMNGEHYDGGQFLPNTTLPKGDSSTRKATKARKVEIAPYEYAEAPEGKVAIYAQLAGVFGRIVDGKMIINCPDATLRYYNRTRAEAQTLADCWNNGERWMKINA